MPAALVLGPDEQANGQVGLKDLRSGKQVLIPQKELVEAVCRLIG